MKEVLENKEKDRAAAKQVAERYRYEFVDLKGSHLDLELFHSIQVDLMFRYNFVPLRLEGNALVVAMADPSDLVVIDEVSALLGRPLVIKVAPLAEILRRAGRRGQAEVLRMPRFQQTEQAIEDNLARQAVRVGLKRIR